jgi:DNA modification methylase
VIERIGEATLYLGDCLEIMPNLGPRDSIITDPPYGIAFQSSHRSVQYPPIVNDENGALFDEACRMPVRHSRYVFCRWDNIKSAPAPRSCITWVKNNWGMGDLEHEHARQSEIALFWPGPDHDFPGDRPSDVVTAPRTGNVEHPTQKPVYLIEQFLGWTRGTVVDPFMGSGTAGVACANMGRKFIGIEIDPEYFEIACERISAAHAQMRLFV